MKRISLEKFQIDRKALIRRVVSEEDTSRVIEEPGIYEVDGKPAIIYGKLTQRYDKMLWAVKSLDYQTSTRTSGLKTTSRIFGYKPRVPMRSDYCAATSLTQTHPSQHAIITEFGGLLAQIYQSYAPETYLKHREQLLQVRREWRMGDTPFTSGIVNWNNPLKYHHDTGNFDGMYSCMVVFRKETAGGFLSIPEFDARFFLDDHSFFMFDGQAILHGVTPIKKTTSNAYRYSVVYYALKAMKQCQSCEEELSRIRKIKRLREKRRL